MVRNKKHILTAENDVQAFDNDDSVVKTVYTVKIIAKGYLYLIDNNGCGTRILIEGKYKNLKVGDKVSL